MLNCTFDEDFYESVSNNVRFNLSCHLDGKLDGSPTAPSPLSPVAVCPTVRSTVVHSPLETDGEIHEATSLSTITAFPTLLTVDQYGADAVVHKYKKPITKNSWKWKWDFVKKYKYVNEGGKIVKKVKQQPTGLRDLSKLDMWTQLVMRKKHEAFIEKDDQDSLKDEPLATTVRQGKRRIVEQLNQILDTRLLPQITLEQDDQRVIKADPDDDEIASQNSPPSLNENSIGENNSNVIPELLNLLPAQKSPNPKVILSGEWARPRCYICFCCGSKFDTLKHLEEHKSGRHPYVNCTHYEIVGRELIEKQFYNHVYLPNKALEQHNLVKNGPNDSVENDSLARLKEKEPISVEDSMDSVTSTSVSVLTSNTNETDTNTKTSKTSTASSSVTQSPMKSVCSKCSKETNSVLDLHRHLLDCSGDYAWAQVKRRLRYRRLLGKKRRVSRGVAVVRRPKSLSKTNDEDDDKEDNPSPKPKAPPTPKVRPSDGTFFFLFIMS